MIDYTTADGIAVLRLDNPPLNAITFELLDELQAGIAQAGADADVYGVMIIGRADHFSAGADITIFDSLVTPDDAVVTKAIVPHCSASRATPGLSMKRPLTPPAVLKRLRFFLEPAVRCV